MAYMRNEKCIYILSSDPKVFFNTKAIKHYLSNHNTYGDTIYVLEHGQPGAIAIF